MTHRDNLEYNNRMKEGYLGKQISRVDGVVGREKVVVTLPRKVLKHTKLSDTSR